MTNLDPQFEHYLNDHPKLTYVQPTDGTVRRAVISGMEVLLGRRKLQSVYNRLKESDFDIERFFHAALEASEINVSYTKNSPEDVDVEGPLIIVANHPFGIVDGMVICDIAAKLRGDFRILINSVLCQDKDLAPHFLPIDFENTRTAIKTNIRTKQVALKSLAEDIPVVIFPSGMVSTADRFGFGAVNDGPWTTFTAKLVRESHATVLPVYFPGRNSRKFHIASHIAEPLRMGMLMHEALNKFDSNVPVTIGDPLHWDSLSHHSSRQDLTRALYTAVQSLAG